MQSTICQHWFNEFMGCTQDTSWDPFNSLRPNRRHVADHIFKCIFENEIEWISPRISLKFVPKVRINNIPALVQIMAWRRLGDKPLSEPMMVSLRVTRPQWVNHKQSTEFCPSRIYPQLSFPVKAMKCLCQEKHQSNVQYRTGSFLTHVEHKWLIQTIKPLEISPGV